MISLVTPFYDADKALLYLQARSVARFVAPEWVQHIYLVYNGDTFKEAEAFFEQVRPTYGSFVERVTLLDAMDVLKGCGTGAGWYRQQAIKLFVESEVNTDSYMVLDCKNHFVKPVDKAYFFKDGKARAFCMDNGFPLGSHYYASYEFLKSTPILPQSGSLQSHTPFIFWKEHVGQLLDIYFEYNPEVYLKEAEAYGLTEFFLYSAFLEKHVTLNDLYWFSEPFVTNVWPKSLDNVERFARRLKETSLDYVAVFGAHLSAINNLDETQARALSKVWVTNGLMNSQEQEVFIKSIVAGRGITAVEEAYLSSLSS